MKRDDVFPSKYLKAADLGGRDIRLVMDYVEKEDLFGQDDPKPVLSFVDTSKRLVLNVTNWNAIEDAYGGESDDWAEKPIILFPAKTQFGSKTVDCVRVRVPANDQDGVTDDVPF